MLAPKEIQVAQWSALHALVSGYHGTWAFRGLGNAGWALQTSLERVGTTAPLTSEAERYLLTAFQRRAHHYISDPPGKEDFLEWLALLQHHGAPTRLLDWTKSPYVALFFALEQRRPQADPCALWAVDLDWCKQRALLSLGPLVTPEGLPVTPDVSLGSPTVFKAAFIDRSLPFVAPLQPFRMNERLTIQQGLFLCPGDLTHSFEDNLGAYSGPDFENHVHKFVIPTVLREEILAVLNKMNINRASLFPGIDGFAQSLLTNLQIVMAAGKLSQERSKLDVYTEYGFL